MKGAVIDIRSKVGGGDLRAGIAAYRQHLPGLRDRIQGECLDGKGRKYD